MLLALLDSDHVDHDRARVWLDGEIATGWASCAITQNGFVRIVSQLRYPSPVAPAEAVDVPGLRHTVHGWLGLVPTQRSWTADIKDLSRIIGLLHHSRPHAPPAPPTTGYPPGTAAQSASQIPSTDQSSDRIQICPVGYFLINGWESLDRAISLRN